MRCAVLGAIGLVSLAAGCGETVDPGGLPSIEGYQDWDAIVATGKVPAHGDTYRIIYVNDIARNYTGGGVYPVGSVLVKDIFDEQGGDLLYTAIMRKLDPASSAAAEVPLEEDDWLYTDLRGGTETYKELCWGSCHRQAPYDGAWLDYGL